VITSAATRLAVYKRRKELKKWVRSLKVGNKCSSKKCTNVCEYKTVKMFDFHHVDPATKFMDVSDMSTRGYSKIRIEEEIKKCVLLCKECHIDTTFLA
jgi:hypothetical protein